MIDLVATGHSWSGGDGPITLMPLVGLVVTFVLARWSLGLRFSPVMLGASTVLGTLFALAADVWGLTMTVGLWIVGALIVVSHVRLVRGTFGRNLSD